MSIEISPLRYPGSKAQLSPFIGLLYDHNEYYEMPFAEPFCGGAALSINMLRHRIAPEVHINDICPYVYSFWKLVADGPEELVRKIWDTKVTMEEHDRQAAICNGEPENYTMLEKAFAAFFVSRTGFGGRIYQVGVRGGRTQDKVWKVDDNFNKKKGVKRIEVIHTLFGLGPIKVYNMPALEFMDHLHRNVDSAFVYLDPPYYQNNLKFYRYNFEQEDHQKLAFFLQRKFRHPWVLSYDDVPEVLEMYKFSCQLRKKYRYRINFAAYKTRGDTYNEGTELILHKARVKVPDDFEEKLLSVARRPPRFKEKGVHEGQGILF